MTENRGYSKKDLEWNIIAKLIFWVSKFSELSNCFADASWPADVASSVPERSRKPKMNQMD